MEWFQSLFSGDSPALTLVLTFFAIAALLIASIWLFRKIAGGGALKPGRNRQPRLSVTDAAIVDEKRRLVLVRRDNVEHLVMIGGPSDIVIEQNIMRVQPSVPPQQQRDVPMNARQDREAEAVRAARAVASRQEQRQSQPLAEPVAPSLDQPPARIAPVAAPIAAAAPVAAAAIAETPQYAQLDREEPLLEPELSELIDEPFVEPEFSPEPEPVFAPEPMFAPEPHYEPEPVHQHEPQVADGRHDADFEFDLEGELERSFDVAPPARPAGGKPLAGIGADGGAFRRSRFRQTARRGGSFPVGSGNHDA